VGASLNTFLKFLLSRDGLVALAALILLAVVAHLNTERPGVNFLARVGNLAVFLYIIWRAAGKQILSFFGGRRAAIAADLENMANRKAEAEKSLADLEARLANLEAEREAILLESRQQAEAMKASIIARAEKDAAAIREQAEKAADSQTRTEIASLRASLADEIAKAVEAALRSGMTPAQHAALIDNSLKKVVLH